MSAELERALAFERAMRERGSTRVEAFRWGTAFFNERFPLSYDHNLAWVERGVDATVDGLVAEADRLFGAAGLEHREIQVLDEDAGVRLAPAFDARGWRVHRHLYMALHREPDRPLVGGSVGEIAWEEFRPLRERAYRQDPWLAGSSEETIQQLLDRHEAVAVATHLRHLAAVDGREPASMCDLYSDGRTAQVEDVFTLEANRGKGLARAVVLAAVEIALAEGHDFVFLVADAADWPKVLYGRLGFDAIGEVVVFSRQPQEPRPA